MTNDKKLQLSLLLMRLGVFIVMFMWTMDKFIRPEHAAAVYKSFYFIGGLGNTAFYVIAAIELVIIIGFLIGVKKKLTYGAVMILHGISAISSYKQYFNPFEGPALLFFAGLPMLAGCIALYLLRDRDTMWVVSK